MVHIQELKEQRGFEFYFTKGVSYSDIQEVIECYKKYYWEGEEPDLTMLKNTEFFPSTKNYQNNYKKVFTNNLIKTK